MFEVAFDLIEDFNPKTFRQMDMALAIPAFNSLRCFRLVYTGSLDLYVVKYRMESIFPRLVSKDVQIEVVKSLA